MTTDQRKCPRCSQIKDAGLFLTTGRWARCAPCRENGNQAATRADPTDGWSASRAANLWSHYRMRPEEYDALLITQERRCAVCGVHEDDAPVMRSGRPRADGTPPAAAFRLVVDHCHNSKRVRGLLCTYCNLALGYLKESRETLLAAIGYLDRSALPLLRDN